MCTMDDLTTIFIIWKRVEKPGISMWTMAMIPTELYNDSQWEIVIPQMIQLRTFSQW